MALNADGLGVPGAESAGLIFAGAAKSSVDNSDGGDGDKVVHVQRSANNAIKWVNDGSIGQEHLLKIGLYPRQPDSHGYRWRRCSECHRASHANRT